MRVADIGELVKVLFVSSRPAGLVSNSELESPISWSEDGWYSDRGSSVCKNGVREPEGLCGEDLGFKCRDVSFRLCVFPCNCWSLVKVGSCVDLREFFNLNSPVATFGINQSCCEGNTNTEPKYTSQSFLARACFGKKRAEAQIAEFLA
jgi:hypothetical protein